MPPRVTYWTGVWQPGREALSNEVQALRDLSGERATIVSFSAGQRSHISVRDRVVRLSGAHWLTLRALAMAVEPRGRVTHAFGAVDAWHFLRCLGRRPLLFTVALPGPPLGRALYDKVSLFAAESEPLAASLVDAGVPASRVRIVYPGVDLDIFTPAPLPPPLPFRLLFASTPSNPAELDARGVPLLIEVARRRPDIEIAIPWRRWGNEDAMARALEALDPPPNVKIERMNVRDMAALYQSAHATVCWFADGFGKSCPNSVIEGLACGRPALVGTSCGIGGLIERRRAGFAVARTVEAMLRAIDQLQDELSLRAKNARALAEDTFGLRRFRTEYEQLYERLGDSSTTPSSKPARR